ncbi:hypothetical protein ACM614_19760 [Streptomyces sp. 12297]|uniref:hypothetical protein n=1 Tax=Streptomyces sp. NBC_00239 TaxID=2903640 RepID=UPI002E2DC581|nr:hypothetical protein [Streptomyces sp. NBC_00239]
MKITLRNGGDQPLNVMFEPAAMEIDIPPRDYIVVEWPAHDDEEHLGSIDYTAEGIVLCPPWAEPLQAWDSQGNELDV